MKRYDKSEIVNAKAIIINSMQFYSCTSEFERWRGISFKSVVPD